MARHDLDALKAQPDDLGVSHVDLHSALTRPHSIACPVCSHFKQLQTTALGSRFPRIVTTPFVTSTRKSSGSIHSVLSMTS